MSIEPPWKWDATYHCEKSFKTTLCFLAKLLSFHSFCTIFLYADLFSLSPSLLLILSGPLILCSLWQEFLWACSIELKGWLFTPVRLPCYCSAIHTVCITWLVQRQCSCDSHNYQCVYRWGNYGSHISSAAGWRLAGNLKHMTITEHTVVQTSWEGAQSSPERNTQHDPLVHQLLTLLHNHWSRRIVALFRLYSALHDYAGENRHFLLHV